MLRATCFAVCLSWLIASCAEQRQIRSVVISPSGNNIAIVSHVSGFLSLHSEVHVHKRGVWFKHDDGMAFSIAGAHELQLTWKDESTLIVFRPDPKAYEQFTSADVLGIHVEVSPP
jgi:hypothetical protein